MARLAIVGVQSWSGLTWHPILVFREVGARVVARHEDRAFRWQEGEVGHRIPRAAVRFVEGPLTREQAEARPA